MLFGGGKKSKKDTNYPGYVIRQDYNNPKATVTAGSYQGTATLPDGIIPLGVRLTWSYASLNHGHGLSLNDKGVIYLEGPGNKSFDITVDLEGKYGWDWLKSQGKFTFANSDPYAMATTIRVVRWAEKNSGGVNSHFKLFKNPFVKPYFAIRNSVKTRWKRGVEHVVRWL